MKCSLSGVTHCLPLLCILLYHLPVYSQDQPPAVSNRAWRSMEEQYRAMDRSIVASTDQVLRKMDRQEQHLRKKLAARDSLASASLFTGSQTTYQSLSEKLHAPVSAANNYPLRSTYIPRLDSMNTALRFLQASQGATGSLAELQQVQAHLQVATEVQNYLRLREQELKDRLDGQGLTSSLLSINKQAWYYQNQVSEIKSSLSQPGKWQEQVLSAVRQSAAFRQFWQKNSYWSRLFPSPAGPDNTTQLQNGLQTRTQLQQEISQKFGLSSAGVSSKLSGSGGGGGAAWLKQQVQGAQTQVQTMKQQLASTGATAYPATAPDFHPNPEHGRSFAKRLEFSLNIQNNTSTTLLPATSSLGIRAGYRLSDRATVGIGASYILGLGDGWNHIRFSNQGIGTRTFLDIRARGSIWVTGALEYNYLTAFSGIRDLRDAVPWQKSALLGLTKKYRLGRRTNDIQLLYDFLANTEIPRGKPIVLRIGWGL